MEEEKVEWHETHKFNHIRRAHAQRGVSQNSGGLGTKQSRSEPKATACRFYQRGLCHHQKDHKTGGVFINTFVLHVLPWVRRKGTWLRNVAHPSGLQKTSRAKQSF